jgi:hypothetical protein
MAEPRKNPFGKQKDSGIGPWGLRTNNPNAKPTSSRKRREQWDMTNKANLVWEDKLAARQRAEANRRLRAKATARAEKVKRDKADIDKFFRDNPNINREDVASFDGTGKPFYKEKQSQGFEKGEDGLWSEVFRKKDGSREYRDPLRGNNTKTDPKTGGIYITDKDDNKQFLGTEIALQRKAAFDKAFHENEARELNIGIQKKQASLKEGNIRGSLAELERKVKHKEKIQKGYEAPRSGRSSTGGNKEYEEDLVKRNVLEDNLSEAKQGAASLEQEDINAKIYYSHIKGLSEADGLESLLSYSEFFQKNKGTKDGLGGEKFREPASGAEDGKKTKPTKPVNTEQGGKLPAEPSPDKSDEAVTVQAAAFALETDTTALDNKVKILAHHAEKEPKNEEAQQKLAEAKEKQATRGPLVSPRIRSYMPIELWPFDASLTSLLGGIEEMTSADSANKIAVGVAGYNGANLSEAKRKLQAEARSFTLQYIYKQLLAELGGDRLSSQIHAYLLMKPDIADTVYGPPGEEGERQIGGASPAWLDDPMPGKEMTRREFYGQAFVDKKAFEQLWENPSKLSQKQKKRIANKLSSRGYIFDSPINIKPTAKWFDDNIDIDAFTNARKRLEENDRQAREYLKYEWRHIEVDPITGLGFSLRLAPDAKGKPIFQYKIDEKIGNAFIGEGKDRKANIKTQTFSSWDEVTMEKHIDLVSRELVDPRKDVGFLEDTNNRLLKAYGKAWMNMAYLPHRLYFKYKDDSTGIKALQEFKRMFNEEFDRRNPQSVASDLKARTSDWLQIWHGAQDGAAQLLLFAQAFSASRVIPKSKAKYAIGRGLTSTKVGATIGKGIATTPGLAVKGLGKVAGSKKTMEIGAGLGRGLGKAGKWTGGKVGAIAPAYGVNLSLTAENMYDEAYEAGHIWGTDNLLLNASGIAFVDSIVDWILLGTGEVGKSLLPKGAYDKMIATRKGVVAAVAISVGSRAVAEGKTEQWQTRWENAYAIKNYDPTRAEDEGEFVSFVVGLFLGGGMGLRTAPSIYRQRMKYAEDVLRSAEGLKNMEDAEKGGDTVREELSRKTGEEITTEDIIDAKYVLSKAHAQKSANLLNIGQARAEVSRVLANVKDLSTETQEAILATFDRGGDPLYNAIAVGNDYEGQNLSLSDENKELIHRALDLQGEVTLAQKHTVVAAIEGYIFIAREVEVILDHGSASRDEYAQALIDTGIAIQVDGSMRVNASAAKVLPENLAKRVRADADLEARGAKDTNVEPAMAGETTTDTSIKENISEGRETINAVAEEQLNTPPLPEWQISIVPNTDPDNVTVINQPIQASSVEKAMSIGHELASQAATTDYKIEVSPWPTETTEQADLPELKPGKKVEATQADQPQSAKSILEAKEKALQEATKELQAAEEGIPLESSEGQVTPSFSQKDTQAIEEAQNKVDKAQAEVDQVRKPVSENVKKAGDKELHLSERINRMVKAEETSEERNIPLTESEQAILEELKQEMAEEGMEFMDYLKVGMEWADGFTADVNFVKPNEKNEHLRERDGGNGVIVKVTKRPITQKGHGLLGGKYLAEVDVVVFEEKKAETTEEVSQQEQVAEEEEVARQTAQEKREAAEDEAGIRQVTRTEEFATGKPGTEEFGQDKATGQNRSGAVDIKDDQETTQKGQPNVSEDTDPFPGSQESVRQREEEKEEESVQEEDAPSEVLEEKPAPKRRRDSRVKELFESDYFIHAIISSGGLISETTYRKNNSKEAFERNKSLWNGKAYLKGNPQFNGIYNPDGGNMPDQMHQILASDMFGFIKPDDSLGEMWEQIDKAAQSATSIAKHEAEQEKGWAKDERLAKLPIQLKTPAGEQVRLVESLNREKPQLRDYVPVDVDDVDGRINLPFVFALEQRTGRQIILMQPSSKDDTRESISGVVHKGAMLINLDGHYATLATTLHEFMHTVGKVNPELYEEFKEVVKKNARHYPELITPIAKRYHSAYDGDTNPKFWAEIEEEAMANIAGDLAMDTKFWDIYLATQPKLSEKFVRAFMKFIDGLLNKIRRTPRKGRTWETVDAIEGLDEVRVALAKVLTESENFHRTAGNGSVFPALAELKQYALDPAQDSFDFTSEPARKKIDQTQQQLFNFESSKKKKRKTLLRVEDPSPPVTTGEIKDFGQKIGGARKDVYEAYKEKMESYVGSDVDITLSKNFPIPNYKQLLKEGVSLETLASIAAIRDSIPAKPKGKYKLRDWADAFRSLRKIANDLLINPDSEVANGWKKVIVNESSIKADKNLRISANFIKRNEPLSDYDLARKANLPPDVVAKRELLKIARKTLLYRALGLPDFTKAKRWSIGYFTGLHYDENGEPLDKPKDGFVAKYNGKVRPSSPKSFKTDVEGATIEIADQIKRVMRTDGDPEVEIRRRKDFFIYTRRVDQSIYIAKKFGSRVIPLKEGFKDITSAREYFKNQFDEIEAIWEKKKNVKLRGEDNRPREGDKLRKPNENIDPDQFMSRFGFRGVEFGNYVGNKLRQKNLNETYDALNDLASVLNIPVEALALNGTLALAFGARGHGGVNPASAHYEAIKIAINLTKKRGAGSLAHEWFHGLDNYFNKLNLKDKAEVGADGFITENITTTSYPSVINMREEVRDAFNDLMQSILGSDYQSRAKKLDETRREPYYSENLELAARAFEAYTIDKLAQKGITNDFLANIDPSSGAYPSKQELAETYSPLFDKLFEGMRYEQTDRGTKLYALDPETDSKYLDLAKNPKANREELQEMVDAAAKEAGYNVRGFHGSPDFRGNVFRVGKFGPLYFFAKDKQTAEYYANRLEGAPNPTVTEAFLKVENPKQVKSVDQKGTGLASKTRREGFDALETASAFVVFLPDQIKSSDPVTRDDNGNIIPLSERFREDKPDIRFALDPETDSKYLDLAKNPDQNYSELARLLDMAADKAGYKHKGWHGTPDGRFLDSDPVFRPREWADTGVHWFAKDYKTASTYADDTRAFDYQNAEPRLDPYYIKIENPYTVDGKGAKWRSAQGIGRTRNVVSKALDDGNDGVIIENVRDDHQTGVVKGDKPTTTYAVFESEQIKTARAVTYDNDGNIVPLSQRFDPDKEDIRFALDPVDEPFYSGIIKKIEKDFPKTATLDQALAFLRPGDGIKKAEVLWMGLNDDVPLMLDEKGKVTKEQLLIEAKKNQFHIRMKEVDRPEYGGDDTTQPGGTNYRELVFYAPEKQFIDRGHKRGRRFTASHFQDLASNVIFHIRISDRRNSDGEKVLFIEEIQSDWGTAYNAYVTRKKKNRGKDAKFKKEARELNKEYRDKYKEWLDATLSDDQLEHLEQHQKLIRHVGDRYIAELTQYDDLTGDLKFTEGTPDWKVQMPTPLSRLDLLTNQSEGAFKDSAAGIQPPDNSLEAINSNIERLLNAYQSRFKTGYIGGHKAPTDVEKQRKEDAHELNTIRKKNLASATSIFNKSYKEDYTGEKTADPITDLDTILKEYALANDLTQKQAEDYFSPLPIYPVAQTLDKDSANPLYDLDRVFEAYEDKLLSLQRISNTNLTKIEFMPFVRSYHEPALKHILRLAVKNNYAGISWATGAQQIELYNATLRKNVSEIQFEWESGPLLLETEIVDDLADILLGEKIDVDIINSESGEVIIPAKRKITKTLLRKLVAQRSFIKIDLKKLINYYSRANIAKNLNVIEGFRKGAKLSDASNSALPKNVAITVIEKHTGFDEDAVIQPNYIGVFPLEGEVDRPGSGAIHGKTLNQLVGKAVGDEIREKVAEKHAEHQDQRATLRHVVKGDNLSIGGQLHKMLYDIATPSFYNEYTKQFNGKVGTGDVGFEEGPMRGSITHQLANIDERLETDRNDIEAIIEGNPPIAKTPAYIEGQKLLSALELVEEYQKLRVDIKNDQDKVMALPAEDRVLDVTKAVFRVTAIRKIFKDLNRVYSSYFPVSIMEGDLPNPYADAYAQLRKRYDPHGYYFNSNNIIKKTKDAYEVREDADSQKWDEHLTAYIADISVPLKTRISVIRPLLEKANDAYNNRPNFKKSGFTNSQNPAKYYELNMYLPADFAAGAKFKDGSVSKSNLHPDEQAVLDALQQVADPVRTYDILLEHLGKIDPQFHFENGLNYLEALEKLLSNAVDGDLNVRTQPYLKITPEMENIGIEGQPSLFALDPIEGKKLASVKGKGEFTKTLARAPSGAILSAYDYIPASEENKARMVALGDKVEEILQPVKDPNPVSSNFKKKLATHIGKMIREGQPKQIVEDLIRERERLENYKGHPDLLAKVEDREYEEAVMRRPKPVEKTKRQQNFINLYNKYKDNPKSPYFKAASKALEKDFGKDWRNIAEGIEPVVGDTRYALDPENLSEDYDAKKAQQARATAELLDTRRKVKKAKKEEKAKKRKERTEDFLQLRTRFFSGKYDYINFMSGLHGGSGKAGDVLRNAELQVAKVKRAVEDYSDKLSREIKKLVGVPAWRILAKAKRLREFSAEIHTTAARLNVESYNPGADVTENKFNFRGFDARMGFMSESEAKARGVAKGSYITEKYDGNTYTLKLGNYIPEMEGYLIVQHFTAEDQQKIYTDFLNKYPDLGIILVRFINPLLANSRHHYRGIKTPIFNRESLKQVFGDAELGDPGFVEGYTPDVAITTLLGAGFLKAKEAAERNPNRKRLGAFNLKTSGARNVKTGAAREKGQTLNIFEGFDVRALEAHLEKTSRENAYKLIEASTKPLPEDGLPHNHIEISKGTLNGILKGMLMVMGDKSARGTSLNKFWQDAVQNPNLSSYQEKVLFNETDAKYDEREKKILEFLFGDKNASRFIGKDRIMDKPTYEELINNLAARHHDYAWVARAVQTVFSQVISGYLTGFATILFNWLSPNFQSFSAGTFRINKAAIYLGTGFTNPENRRRAEYELRAGIQTLKGLVTRRFSNWNGIDFLLTGEDYLKGKLSEADYDKGAFKLIKEGQFGKALKALTDRNHKYGEIINRERFDNNTLVSGIEKVNPKDTIVKDLLNLKGGSAMLKIAQFHEMDPTVKQNLEYASYKAHAQMAYNDAVREARGKGQKITTPKKKWMREWMKNVKDDGPIHEEARGTSMLFAFDYSNIPMWLDSKHPLMQALKPTFFTFSNFIYNYGKLLINLSPLGMTPKLIKSKGKKDALGGAEWRNAASGFSMFAMATLLYQMLGDDDDKESELESGKVGKNVDISNKLLKKFWVMTGGKINLDQMPDIFGERITNSVRAYFEAYGAEDAVGHELWLRGRALPYLNMLATQDLWVDALKDWTSGEEVNFRDVFTETRDMAMEFVPRGPVMALLTENKYDANKTQAEEYAGLTFDIATSRMIFPSTYWKFAQRLTDPIARRKYKSEPFKFNETGKDQFLNEWKRNIPLLSRTVMPAGSIKTMKLDDETESGDGVVKTTTFDHAMIQREDVKADLLQLARMGVDLSGSTLVKPNDDGVIQIKYPDPATVRIVTPAERIINWLFRIESVNPIEKAVAMSGVDDYRAMDRLIGKAFNKPNALTDKDRQTLEAWSKYTQSSAYRDSIRNNISAEGSLAERLQEEEEIAGLPVTKDDDGKEISPPSSFLRKVVENMYRDQYGRLTDLDNERPINLKLTKHWMVVPENGNVAEGSQDPMDYVLQLKKDSTTYKDMIPYNKKKGFKFPFPAPELEPK